MATRRGLFGFLTVPLWPWSAGASASSGDGTITINPRDLWLRSVVYRWLRNAQSFESNNANVKRWDDYYGPRDDIVYLTEILALDTEGLRQLLRKPWYGMVSGATSHFNFITNRLKTHEEDGRLHLHLNPKHPDFFAAYKDEDFQSAYAKVFPIVKEMLEDTEWA